MVNVYYSSTYVGTGYSFDTTRKAKWVADSLIQSPLSKIQLLEPKVLTKDQVTQVHDLDYVMAIENGENRQLAESQGFQWDAQLFPMVLASNGGVVDAALHALEYGGVAGSLSSGLHHAQRAHGAGYCTFNGLAIAAHSALAAGAQSVLILDLDAHCGGGTQSLIKDESKIWQVDISVDDYDHYESSDQYELNIVENGANYLPSINSALEKQKRHFDLCIYNAGMDPFENCSIGGKTGINYDILANREKMVFEWCKNRNLPVAFVLAGGYIGSALNQTELVNLHRLTLSAAS